MSRDGRVSYHAGEDMATIFYGTTKEHHRGIVNIKEFSHGVGSKYVINHKLPMTYTPYCWGESHVLLRKRLNTELLTDLRTGDKQHGKTD